MENKPLPFIPTGNPHYNLSGKRHPYIVKPTRPVLLGGRLIIENDQFIGIETTEGTYIPKSRQGLGEYLSGKRILILDNIKKDLNLLLKAFFTPEENYYLSHSHGLKFRIGEHAHSWGASDTSIEIHPCPCRYPSCDWKDHKLPGWIEVVRDPYEVITGTKLGSPIKSPPSIQEIESLFKEQEDLCGQEGIYIKYSNRAGKIIGDILMQNGVGTWSTKHIDNPNLWTQYMNMADEAVPAPLTLAKQFGISMDLTLEDRDGAHPGDFGKCVKISPKTHNIAGHNQITLDNLLEMAEGASEITTEGVLVPGQGEPGHIRQETTGGTRGVLPTYRPHYAVLNKTALLHELSTGGNFIPTSALVITNKRGKKWDTTYKLLAEKLYYYKKSIPLIKWAVKAVAGKMGSYSWDRRYHSLLGDNNGIYKPLKWIPDEMSTDYEDTNLVFSAIFDPGLRCQLLSHTAVRLRQEINSKIARVREYNQDSLLYTVDSSGVHTRVVVRRQKGLGEFRPQNIPGAPVLVLNDSMVDFIGANHKDPLLEIFKDAPGNSKVIKGEKQLIRRGLEVYKEHNTPYIAHQLQGQLYTVEPVYPIGTNKLIGPVLTKDSLGGGPTSLRLYRYSYTDDEIKEVLEKNES